MCVSECSTASKTTHTCTNAVRASSNEDLYFSKSSLIETNLMNFIQQLPCCILHCPTSWTVKHSRLSCRQNTLIRDENDHIKVSNTQILQVGPRQTDSEGSTAFCQTLALTFSLALNMVPRFKAQIGNFIAKETLETSMVPSNWYQKLPKTHRVSPQGSLQCQLLANPCRWTSGKMRREIKFWNSQISKW